MSTNVKKVYMESNKLYLEKWKLLKRKVSSFSSPSSPILRAVSSSFSNAVKEDVLKCPYCPYSAAFNSILKRHILTHTGERPFTCTVCHKGIAYYPSEKWSTCWVKSSNCDADLSSPNAGETRRCRSHTPRCTTSRDDRWIARIEVMDRTARSRSIAQHIQSVTHHSMSARTIQRHLQLSGMSARLPLLRLLLTGNHRRLRH
ncbi:transposable element Tcb1 transposase [Trichonephila clavipes]|nr:transposable element Tcb1 transposase [Trichonephila clavipes]